MAEACTEQQYHRKPSYVTANWEVYQSGISVHNWSTAMSISPVMSWCTAETLGGTAAHSSTVHATDLASKGRSLTAVKVRGTWATTTDYITDDIVKSGSSSYIALTDHTSNNFTNDLNAAKWQEFAVGGSYVLPATANNVGKYLSSDGSSYVWVNGETGWQSITTTHTAVSTERLFTDTSGGLLL